MHVYLGWETPRDSYEHMTWFSLLFSFIFVFVLFFGRQTCDRTKMEGELTRVCSHSSSCMVCQRIGRWQHSQDIRRHEHGGQHRIRNLMFQPRMGMVCVVFDAFPLLFSYLGQLASVFVIKMLKLCMGLMVRVTNLFKLGWEDVTSSRILDASVPKVSLWDFSLIMESDTARVIQPSCYLVCRSLWPQHV